jgi:hypothetical protein
MANLRNIVSKFDAATQNASPRRKSTRTADQPAVWTRRTLSEVKFTASERASAPEHPLMAAESVSAAKVLSLRILEEEVRCACTRRDGRRRSKKYEIAQSAVTSYILALCRRGDRGKVFTLAIPIEQIMWNRTLPSQSLGPLTLWPLMTFCPWYSMGSGDMLRSAIWRSMSRRWPASRTRRRFSMR